MEDPVLFTLAVLAVLGTPGPTNTLLATAGATGGVRRSLPLVPAEAGGYSISILALGAVLGPLMSGSPVLAGVLRATVSAYLLLLAVRLWRRGALAGALRGAVVTPAQVFVTTLLNPKALVFALGIVPFGPQPRVWPTYMLGFLLLVASVALCWITAGAVLGRAATSRGWGGAVRGYRGGRLRRPTARCALAGVRRGSGPPWPRPPPRSSSVSTIVARVRAGGQRVSRVPHPRLCAGVDGRSVRRLCSSSRCGAAGAASSGMVWWSPAGALRV